MQQIYDFKYARLLVDISYWKTTNMKLLDFIQISKEHRCVGKVLVNKIRQWRSHECR